MTNERWQLAGDAAELYERYLVPTVTAMWAEDLADRAGLGPGERVLDVACGTGVVARAAAARVGPRGRVDAVDFNAGMLAVGRSILPDAGGPIEWYEASALALPFGDGVFDVAMCQLGLQFFSDRAVALAEMRRVLVPAGRLALSVFGPISRNPAPSALAEALERHVGRFASEIKRGEHVLADVGELCALVTEAGFREVRCVTSTKMVRFPTVADYIEIQLVATPLAGMFGDAKAGDAQQLSSTLTQEIGVALAPYCSDAGLIVPQEVHSVTGHK